MLSRPQRVNSVLALRSSPVSLEFTVDHIYDIRSAVVCLLDSIASLVESPNIMPPESYFDINQQISLLNESVFKGVHDRYLWWSSSFQVQNELIKAKSVHSARPAIRTTSQHGFAIKYSRLEANRFLQTLMTGFENCKAVLLQSLKRKSEKETQLYQQVVALKNELQKHERQAVLAHKKIDDGGRDIQQWIEKVEELNRKLSGAEKKITELERNKDVLKWQKYSDEVASRHILAVDEIKEKFILKTKNQVKTQENLENKIKKLEAEVLRLRAKNEAPVFQNSIHLEQLDRAKQQLFMRDQEIHVLKKQLDQLHRCAVGSFNGLQEDFKRLLENDQRSFPGKAFSPDRDHLQFQAKLRLLHDESAQGNLASAVKSLPSYYKATKIDHVSQNCSQKSESSLKISKIQAPRVDSFRTQRSVSRSHNHPTCGNEEKLSHHPQLVDPRTEQVNLYQVGQHFPYLSADQVSQQWKNFIKFDKNKDRSLDLPELYEIISDVFGLKITVSEMREAMAEVDRDKSNNIDFYEYLKVVEMIVKKKGKSAVFRSEELHGHGLHESKDCVLQ